MRLLQKIGKALLNSGDQWQILQLYIQTAFQCASSVSACSSIYGSIVELLELAASDSKKKTKKKTHGQFNHKEFPEMFVCAQMSVPESNSRFTLT